MSALIYTAMSGANRALKALEVRANNLANAGTTGFRADIEAAASQTVPGYGFDARHQATHAPSRVDLTTGTLSQTGRDLDVAIDGDGMLAVEAAGGEGYTRAGHFEVDADGVLRVGRRAVLGDGGPITLPPSVTQVSVSASGEISVLAAGETELVPVDRLKLVRPPEGSLVKSEEGLLVARDGTPFVADDTVRVKGGYLEQSNVSAVEEMIATMALNRSFEMQMKVFSSAGEMVDAGNRLIRG